MHSLYDNGMGRLPRATVDRLRQNLNQVLEKEPSNGDALTQRALLEYGHATQPLAKHPNTNPRGVLMDGFKLDTDSLRRVIVLLKETVAKGVQDRRVFRALGLASWQLCVSSDALGVAHKDGEEDDFLVAEAEREGGAEEDGADAGTTGGEEKASAGGADARASSRSMARSRRKQQARRSVLDGPSRGKKRRTRPRGEHGKETLLTAYQFLGRVSTGGENARNPLFLTTFARVCEANGDIMRAITVLGDMVNEFSDWLLLPHTVLYASNLCFHPSFGSTMYMKGLQYLEWLAGEPPTGDEFGWTEPELLFAVARAYQIAGRGDLAAPKFRKALQKKTAAVSVDSVKDEALVAWLSNKATWEEQGIHYTEAGLNLFAADAFAQMMHITQEAHTAHDWLLLGDALRRCGAFGPSVKALAHAYEIDRAHGGVRHRLASWSPEWADLFRAETRYVIRIQSHFRRFLAQRAYVKLQEKMRVLKWNAKTIQRWWVYQLGRIRRKRRREDADAICVRIKLRMRNNMFRAWQFLVAQRKDARGMRRRIIAKVAVVVMRNWHEWAILNKEIRRQIAERQKANEELVAKCLNKILKRAQSEAFTSWTIFTRRSIGVKQMLRRAMLAQLQFCKDRWYSNVRDAIEERRMKIEPTVFVRRDDLTRRLHHADLLTRPGPLKVRKQLQPYVVGPGESWRRDSHRSTAIHTALFRAKKTGDTVLVPGDGTPVAEDELNEFMKFPSVISMCAPLTPSDGRTLAEKLVGNRAVRSMLLYNGMLSDKGVMAIGAALAESSGVVLQTLGVGNHDVGVRGCVALADALRARHCSLTTLYLEKNPAIGDEGLQVLADALGTNVRLEKLVLGSNNIGNRGVTALAEALRKNRSLRSLALHDNKISSTGCGALATLVAESRNKSLSTIALNNNSRIGDDGAIAFSHAIAAGGTHLIDLDLGACGINDLGAMAISRALYRGAAAAREVAAKEVDSDSDMDINEAVRAVGDPKGFQLQRLGLCNNNIHSASASKIAAALNKVATACGLDLEGNPIDDTTRGELIFGNFNKRLGSPRRGASPRRAEDPAASPPYQTGMSAMTPPSGHSVPSREALESLGRTGLGGMTFAGSREERDEDRGAAPDLSLVASFSPQGFTMKRLPPIKPGLRGSRRPGLRPRR